MKILLIFKTKLSDGSINSPFLKQFVGHYSFHSSGFKQQSPQGVLYSNLQDLQ